jgi:hypothetical protein
MVRLEGEQQALSFQVQAAVAGTALSTTAFIP